MSDNSNGVQGTSTKPGSGTVTVKRYNGRATATMTREEFEKLNKKHPGEYLIVEVSSTKTVEPAKPATAGQDMKGNKDEAGR